MGESNLWAEEAYQELSNMKGKASASLVCPAMCC